MFFLNQNLLKKLPNLIPTRIFPELSRMLKDAAFILLNEIFADILLGNLFKKFSAANKMLNI